MGPRSREAGAVGIRPRNEPSREPGEQEDARETLPLLVRGEELSCLAVLRPRAGARCDELHETEVADEPVVVAPESSERDDAHAPRTDSALTSEPADGAVAVCPSEGFELDRSHHPCEGGGPARSETTCAKRGG